MARTFVEQWVANFSCPSTVTTDHNSISNCKYYTMNGSSSTHLTPHLQCYEIWHWIYCNTTGLRNNAPTTKTTCGCFIFLNGYGPKLLHEQAYKHHVFNQTCFNLTSVNWYFCSTHLTTVNTFSYVMTHFNDLSKWHTKDSSKFFSVNLSAILSVMMELTIASTSITSKLGT